MENKVKNVKREKKEKGFDKQILLKRAEKQFLKSEYLNALRIYSLILNDYPQTKDAKVGVFLSDIGLDSDEDAQALFDYYQVLKDTDEDADSLINELLDAFYATRFIVQDSLVNFFNDMDVDNGITYSDFLNLIEAKGSFKKAFEDTMFSTKVIIQTKREFILFIKQLIESGYQEIALKYLDNLSDSFGNDQEVYRLYYLIDMDMEKK